LRRDIEQRGRTPESVKRQYEATVRPAGEAFVRPSGMNADLQVDGAGALDWKVERVLSEMHARGLLTATL
jgi:uridine kinase